MRTSGWHDHELRAVTPRLRAQQLNNYADTPLEVHAEYLSKYLDPLAEALNAARVMQNFKDAWRYAGKMRGLFGEYVVYHGTQACWVSAQVTLMWNDVLSSPKQMTSPERVHQCAQAMKACLDAHGPERVTGVSHCELFVAGSLERPESRIRSATDRNCHIEVADMKMALGRAAGLVYLSVGRQTCICMRLRAHQSCNLCWPQRSLARPHKERVRRQGVGAAERQLSAGQRVPALSNRLETGLSIFETALE
eukprot:4968497-Amphidinium_carterae.1